MPQWFGSSGIRGSYQDINPEFSMKLGISVARMIRLNKPAYIASDIRYTSGLLKSSFMSGYSSESGSVVDIGLAPTPVLSFLSYLNTTLGIMLTASHNPPSNNGFKLFLNGGECGETTELEIEKVLKTELNSPINKTTTQVNWRHTGKITHANNRDFFELYLKYLLNYININDFEQKIVLDCANNVPNLISPFALEKIGFKNIITINKELNALFPGRPSEPSAENLRILCKTVIDEKASIGIAHDGDGDRFAIIDENGRFINPTALISFFVDHLDYSNPNKNNVVLTSDCTKQAKYLAEKNGATVVISKIGKNREHVNDTSVLFLAEPNKLIFPELGKWIDGLFPVLKLLELTKSKLISKVMEKYDKRKILRRAFRISEEDRVFVQTRINELPKTWPEKINEISYLDGIKLYFKNDSSLLVRFSGTEPKIKFYIESSSVKKNQEILNLIIKEFNFPTPGIEC